MELIGFFKNRTLHVSHVQAFTRLIAILCSILCNYEFEVWECGNFCSTCFVYILIEIELLLSIALRIAKLS